MGTPSRSLSVVAVAICCAVSATAQEVIYQYDGRWATDERSGRRAGDVNGDGVPDFIIRSLHDQPGDSYLGHVWVHSGRDGSELLSVAGTPTYPLTDAATAGDVDADGFVDVAIIASARPCHVFVLSGRDGRSILHIEGSAQDELFVGTSSAGDVNGDGRGDLVIGDPRADFTGYDTGSAFVFSGSTGAKLYQWNGVYHGDAFGEAVSGLGDVNRDSYDDVMVSQPGMDVSGLEDAGSVFVYSGRDGSRMKWIKGWGWRQGLGTALDRAGDLDDDGYPDLLIGAAGNFHAQPGSAYVLSGRDWSRLLQVDGSGSDGLGLAVAGGHDVNGDGTPDFLVWAFSMDYSNVYSGRFGTKLYTYDYVYRRDGVQISGPADLIGDVNGDGRADLIGSNSRYGSLGAVWVFSGSDLFLTALPRDPAAGNTLSLTTAQGKPHTTALFAAVTLDGGSIFVPLVTGTFDASGQWAFSSSVPGGLAGRSVGLKAFGVAINGRIVPTATTELTFR